MGCSNSQAVGVSSGEKASNKSQVPNQTQKQGNQVQGKEDWKSKFTKFVKENGFMHLQGDQIAMFAEDSQYVCDQESFDSYYSRLLPGRLDLKPFITYLLKEVASYSVSIGLTTETLNQIINETFLLFLADPTDQSIKLQKQKFSRLLIDSARNEEDEYINTSKLVDLIKFYIIILFNYFWYYVIFLTAVPNGIEGLKAFFVPEGEAEGESSHENLENYIDKERILKFINESFIKEYKKEVNFNKAEQICNEYIFKPIKNFIQKNASEDNVLMAEDEKSKLSLQFITLLNPVQIFNIFVFDTINEKL